MKCRKEDSISGWRIPYGPGTHQGVDQVGAFPHQIQGQDGAHIDHHDIRHFVDKNPFVARYIAVSLFSQVGPADQGGDGKSHQAQG